MQSQVQSRFNQLFNAHRVNGVQKTEIHTAEPLMPDHKFDKIKIGIENVKKY
jgi:hypothetical protein